MSAASGALVLGGRELKRFARQPSRIVASVATPMLLWVVFASGLGGAVRLESGASYGTNLLPAMLSLVVVFSAVFAGVSLIEDRRSGFLRPVLVSPAPRLAVVLGKVGAGSVLAVGQAALLVPIAWWMAGRPGAVGVAVSLLGLGCAGVLVTGLSLALAWRVGSVQGFHGVMNLVLMPMWLLGGGLFPREEAADWMRAVMTANPLTWCNELVLSGLGGKSVDAGMIGVAVACGAAGVLAAWWSMTRRVSVAYGKDD